jgi:hypothetical protein
MDVQASFKSTKQYKLCRADYCLFACMDHVASQRNTLESRPSAGTLHIRPCSIPSLPVAFGLVPGIGEILWTRRVRYGIHEGVSGHQRREPCMALRGAAWQSKVWACNIILCMDGILLTKLSVQCDQHGQSIPRAYKCCRRLGDFKGDKKHGRQASNFATFFQFAITVTPTITAEQTDPSGRGYSDSANLLFRNVSPGWPSVSPSRSGVVESPRRGSGLSGVCIFNPVPYPRLSSLCLCGEKCLGAICLGRCRVLCVKYSILWTYWGYRRRSLLPGFAWVCEGVPGFASITVLGLGEA